MDIKHFKLVDTIAAVGSLTKAAEKLFLTQSALSHQLKEIEEQLGTSIFNRINKKLVLTEAGKLFLNSSGIILQEINKLKAEIKQQLTGESGMIRLTTECYTCYHWLPKILKNYNKEFPSVDIRLNSSQVKNPLNLLLEGKVDIAVVYGKTIDKNIQYIDLFNDDLVVLVAINSPLASKQFVGPNDFSELPFVTQNKHFEGTYFYEAFLKAHQIKPKKLIYIQYTESVIEMVREGLGITVLARWLVQPYIDQNKVKALKIGANGLKRKWYLATLKKSDSPRFLNRFIQHLKVGIPF
jgi:LysR family transcriptional regulator, regulator for metE and metH